MRKRTTLKTEPYNYLLEAFLSAGADKKKTEVAIKSIIKSNTFNLEKNTQLDLENPNDVATKKDLKILELNIQKEIADNKIELIKWLIATQLGVVGLLGVIITLIKLL